jgi:chemotaxis protein MotB
MAAYDQPVTIKKVKKGGHGGHHGGAWKIAYADFVTAMMAFFLLLWLISMTTDEQKKGLADYFAPPNVSQTTSGAGGVLAGTAMDEDGAKMAPLTPDANQAVLTSKDTTEFGQATEVGGREVDTERETDAQMASQTDFDSSYDQTFHSAAASIRQAWQANPDLTEISDSLIVEQTREGLNIVISDQQGRRMFPEGSKYPTEQARAAIAAVAPVLARLSNQIEISGHTAAGAVYSDPRYGPWELSSDRANVVRAILGEFGLAEERVKAVVGHATTEPLFPNDPYLSGNERIEVTVLNESSPVPPDMTP